MRASQAEKDRSHRRIIDGAARLVRERGIEATSVSDVMADAGMTNGGFYKHFDSKDALVTAALRAAFDDMIAIMDARLDAPDALPVYQDFYLSKGHVAAPGAGCPVAALSGDVARAPEALKAEFGAGVRRTLAAIAKSLPVTDDDRQADAARMLATLVGAVVIARASDTVTAEAILAAVHEPRPPRGRGKLRRAPRGKP